MSYTPEQKRELLSFLKTLRGPEEIFGNFLNSKPKIVSALLGKYAIDWLWVSSSVFYIFQNDKINKLTFLLTKILFPLFVSKLKTLRCPGHARGVGTGVHSLFFDGWRWYNNNIEIQNE